jgi:3-dehydroquinate synthase
MVERGLLNSGPDLLRELVPSGAQLFLACSEPVLGLWGNEFKNALTATGCDVALLPVPDGERAKRFATVEKLATKMVRSGADRRCAIVALGGGVVGDVGAFLASIFMRGIPVIQAPTTLVAQVDSAIGGKTGVNLLAGKNLIGTFHQPLAVLADPAVLSTLPEREYRSGLFEAMKYGVIRNPAIFDLMESQRDGLLHRDAGLLETLIAECVRVKAAVVSADEREEGERRILNFGHTVGHALEAATGYKTFLHGEAVGWGMIAAALIGRQLQITEAQTAERILGLVLAYGPLPCVSVDAKRIVRLLQSDKKTLGGVPHFVLATTMGSVDIVNRVLPEVVVGAVEELKGVVQSR